MLHSSPACRRPMTAVRVRTKKSNQNRGHGHVRYHVGRDRPQELEQPSPAWSERPRCTPRSPGVSIGLDGGFSDEALAGIPITG